MKKHYLHNQNYKNDIDVGDSTNKNLLKTKNVDINILLNRIKLKEKGKKKRNDSFIWSCYINNWNYWTFYIF